MRTFLILSIIALSVFNTQALNPEACLSDALSLVNSLQALKNDISSLNLADLAAQVQNIEADIPKIKTDCLPSVEVEFSPIACVEDIEQVVSDAEKLVADIKSGDTNINDYISQIEALISLVQKAEADCASSLTFKLKSFEQFNPSACLADVQNLVQVVQTIKSDLSSGNFLDVLTQVESLQALVPSLKSDCLPSSQLDLSPVACIEDVEQIVSDVEALVANLKSGNVNLSELISQVESLVSLAQKAGTDCSVSNQAQQTVTLNPEQCIADLSSFVQTVEAVEADIQNKNFLDLLNQVSALEQELPALKTDCLSSTEQLSNAFNPLACFSDVKQAVALGQQLVNDIKSGDRNISDYIAQVQQLVAVVQQIKTDCSFQQAKKFLA